MRTTTLARRVLLAAALATALPGIALAQAFPAKPIRVIVSFAPGGAADQIARAVSEPLAQALGQPVVVENRAGANGNIAGDFVSKQPADGYTLLMSSGGTVSINPHLYAKMSFDPAKDLVPVASAARVLVYLQVNPAKVPVNNAKEFLAYMKANPGKLSFGSPGNGSSPHLAGEMMKSMGNVYATHIPYRGAAPAIQDLLAGQVDFMFDPGVGLQHTKAGKLKLLAIGSPKRSPLYPDVPTMEEAGLKGFDADTWFGFYAPAGTPQPVVARLNTEINKVLRSPAFVERMNAIGAIPAPFSPQEFGARAQEDSKRFGALIRERRIVGD
ncbi:tripartite tricarboxylate transporter substrate binding protein [Ramlibacter sp. USB13]|uniref:Tripartite tricarboxylate transporter substrate binding protein n=1 Tax=Ramlibacter cellulosilyticus TaxID=2764187 RepID=A0A923MMV3_9BURK|nr:tripartite tricarboxylate transporter substrate binding protein [Ramlibacter cellulosilyticus]MBC5781593.1 tripartite tricarboxylate transporter substrate binding protein [Ramlibacter cellulosilyticus]